MSGRKGANRRSGVSVAACALGASLIITGAPAVAGTATAQEPTAESTSWKTPRTEAARTDVTFPDLVVAPGETAKSKPELKRNFWTAAWNKIGTPVKWELKEGFSTPTGWHLKFSDDGTLNATAGEGIETTTFKVPVTITFADGSTKDVEANVTLADGPTIEPIKDQKYWEGRLIQPRRVMAWNVPADAVIELEGLPAGLSTSAQTRLGSGSYLFINGRPTETGTFNVTARVTGAGDPLEETFTITVADSAELGEPEDADIAPSEVPPVRPGTDVHIPLDVEDASSVEVEGLPDGLKYDGEQNAIVGTPTKEGTSKVVVDKVTEDGTHKRDSFELTVDENAPEPSEPSEPSEPADPSDPAEPADPSDPEGPVAPDQFEWNPIKVRAGEETGVTPVRSTQGVRVLAEPGNPDWFTVFANGAVYAAPSRDAKPGTYTMKVRTEKGEQDTITVEVTAAVKDSVRYESSYADTYVRAGGTATSPAPYARLGYNGMVFERQPLPKEASFSTEAEGVKLNQHTGQITLSADLDAEVGKPIDVPVTVTYPDGSTKEIIAHFQVLAPQFAQTQKFEYERREAFEGETIKVNLTEPFDPASDPEFAIQTNASKYQGWDLFIDATTGTITATAPAQDAKPLNVEVVARYSDGSSKTVVAVIGVRDAKPQAYTSNLDFEDAVVGDDGTVTITPKGDIPTGVTFEPEGAAALGGVAGLRVDVDEKTGQIKVTLPKDAKPGQGYDLGVRINFPDGGSKVVQLNVARDSQAHREQPSWTPIGVAIGANAVTHEPKVAPKGATYAISADFAAEGWKAAVDATTGALTVAAPASAHVGDRTMIPIVVTFEDGSQKLVEAQATAVKAMGGAVSNAYDPTQVRAGETVTLTPTLKGAHYSLLNPVGGLDTRIDATTGALTVGARPNAVPGVREVPVRINFPDGSTTIANARISVLTSDGKPSLAEATPEFNDTIKAYPGKATTYVVPKPAGAAKEAFALGQLPKALADWKIGIDATTGELTITPPAGTAPGIVPVPVVVSFADGSQATKLLRVQVVKGPQEVEKGSSTSSEIPPGAKIAGFVLGLLAFLGGLGYSLYEHRDFFRTFLAFPINQQR
ncbi:YPDG domain-containing protein [Corynebacterium sp. UMB10119B.1]|uniref:YPDG domain-containing protein n=1 Tax=Corynebacterium sp. UMB10119B.1 TaxID=3050601 RepID=UPI00254AC01C|nr:YPDG domain-containing protein [Corynebacterium sp. UMB10119B]MDK8364805.1 YPDG domain-containing protein [Corynebacterium sp. UMB10119B]